MLGVHTYTEPCTEHANAANAPNPPALRVFFRDFLSGCPFLPIAYPVIRNAHRLVARMEGTTSVTDCSVRDIPVRARRSGTAARPWPTARERTSARCTPHTSRSAPVCLARSNSKASTRTGTTRARAQSVTTAPLTREGRPRAPPARAPLPVAFCILVWTRAICKLYVGCI